jgi:hypothetical protein
MDYYEKLKNAQLMSETEFIEIKMNTIKFLNGKTFDNEEKKGYIMSYLKQNYPALMNIDVTIAAEMKQNSCTLSMDNVFTTKPLAEILCETI